MNASVAVLNVGAGDVAVTFNPSIEDEKARAIDMLRDMLQRGYAIMVRLDDGTYARVHEIDAARCSYIIGERAPVVTQSDEAAADVSAPAPRRRGRPRGPQRRSIPMAGSTTIAIARSAGG